MNVKKKTMLSNLLAHPLTKGMDLDDPHTTQLRKEIISEKAFLRRIYEDWYTYLVTALPSGAGQILELGAGAGFFSDFLPEVISSEIFLCPDINVVLDGLNLPFANNTLRGIVMTDVFHHIPDSKQFLLEATRCVRPGGVIAMIEPWKTPWSQFIYQNLHHEPFQPQVVDWKFPAEGPLSGANGALPWIVFERDLTLFERDFPEWEVEKASPFMPFSYLLSGGISMRSFLPGYSYNLFQILEQSLSPFAHKIGMFAQIIIRRK